VAQVRHFRFITRHAPLNGTLIDSTPRLQAHSVTPWLEKQGTTIAPQPLQGNLQVE
jgi:hypothetical protein